MRAARAGLLFGCVLVAAPVALAAASLSRPGGPVARWLGRVFCRVTLRLLRIEVVVAGRPPAAAEGRLVVANHVSWLDPLVLFAVSPCAVLAKREVGTWPVIRTLARLQATVLVDRGRRMRIPSVNRELAHRLGEGCNVLLFPEGTTYDGTRRGRFLTSHLACLAAVPGPSRPAVQAAALAYSDPAAAWVGDDTLLPHLWSVLSRPGMKCHVAYGDAADAPARLDRKALGRQLAAEIEALLAPRRPPVPAATTVLASGTGLIMTEA